ncbi:hypothetical protein ACJ72_08441, partial [Emergomyces africanus]
MPAPQNELRPGPPRLPEKYSCPQDYERLCCHNSFPQMIPKGAFWGYMLSQQAEFQIVESPIVDFPEHVSKLSRSPCAVRQ